jgi:ribonuclease P protein component
MTPAVGRLQGRRTFRALSRPDGRGSCGPVHASYAANPQLGQVDARVGYAVGKAHGNAVRRNRLRRRLRAAVAAVPAMTPGDYLIRTSIGAHTSSFTDLVDAVAAATTAATNRQSPGHTTRVNNGR